MTHSLVKVLVNDDGVTIKEPVWHLLDPGSWDASRTLCGGEAFGTGESNVKYEYKTVKRGGITCRTCLEQLKSYKSIEL